MKVGTQYQRQFCSGYISTKMMNLTSFGSPGLNVHQGMRTQSQHLLKLNSRPHFFIKLQFHRVIISVKVRIKSNFHLKIEIKVAHCRAGGLWSEDFPEKL